MVTEVEYAELSNRVYMRTDQNRTPVPAGWTELRWLPDRAYSGFSAGVYQKGNEVVISLTGTNEGKALDFLAANIPIGLGATSSQVIQAMTLYLQTKAEFPGATISFTGHSLGGGLASMMAVFFDAEATVFDPAPLERGARSQISLTTYLAAMSTLGYSDPTFTAYVTGLASDFSSRENRVHAVSIESEILGLLREFTPTIYGGIENIVPIGAQTLLDTSDAAYLAARTELHSMTLLTCMLRSQSFAAAVQQSPSSLELFFDVGLYKQDPESAARPNFLDRLLIADMGASSTGLSAQPLLDRIAADLQRINVNSGMAAQMRASLAVAIMEYYYFNEPSTAIQLISSDGGGVHFDFAAITDPQFTLKSPRRLSESVQSFLSPDEWSAVGYKLETQDAWHVQSGNAGMLWAANGAIAYDAAIGGAGTDILDAGGGDDVLVGGAGQDFLTGGSGSDVLIGGVDVDSLYGGNGNDHLFGGAGADIYAFVASNSGTPISFGNDVIEDSDGAGTITVDGNTLPSAQLVRPGVWRSAADAPMGQVTYTQSGAGASSTLSILIAGRTDTITIRGWQQGQLGINLSGTAAPETSTHVIYGDLGTLVDENGNPQFESTTTGTPNLITNGVASAGRPDLLRGGDGNDELFGLAGYNSLSGRGGDDHLVGGVDNELISGGSGDDWIEAGDGIDLIFGGAEWEGSWSGFPIVPDTNPTWGSFLWSAGISTADGSILAYFTGEFSADDDGGDVIDAGAGTDFVDGDFGDDIIVAGAGPDVAHGGHGNDSIFGGTENDELWGDGVIQEGVYQYIPQWLFGSDVIDGGEGADTLYGQGGDDSLFGGIGDDVLLGDLRDLDNGWHGDDYLDGGDGNDHVLGEGGSDSLFGGAGDDQIQGDDQHASLAPSFHGNDYLDGEGDNDLILGGGYDDTLFGGSGDDTLWGDDAGNNSLPLIYRGDDYLDGEDGVDRLIGDAGSDTLFGGLGDDTLWGDSDVATLSAGVGATWGGEDFLDGEDGDDALVGGALSDTLVGGAGTDRLDGDGISPVLEAAAHGNDYLDGGSGEDTLTGDGGSDTLFGGADNDQLDGDREGSAIDVQAADWLYGDGGDDVLKGGGGGDFLYGGNDTDYLWGDYENSANGGSDVLHGDAGNDFLYGGIGTDRLDGGEGDDYLDGDSPGTSAALQGSDELYGGSGNDTLIGQRGDDYLSGGIGVDTLNGGDGDDYLDGGIDADSLQGGAGDDTLVGADGADTLAGGSGNDSYDLAANSALVVITELAGEGLDVVTTQASTYTLAANVEFLVLSGFDAQSAIGNGLDNVITGTLFDNTLSGDDGNDMLDGKGGTDVLIGGMGNDTYTVYGTLDSIVEDINAGIDTVQSGASYTLAVNFENLTLTGSADIDGTGNAAANAIIGNAGANRLFGQDGNDMLDGGAGADLLVGGVGDDTFVVDGPADIVVELASQGVDSLQSSVSIALAANVENLTLTGSAAIDGTGNLLANNITGNANNNILDGGGGIDILRGSAGDDVYLADSTSDAVLENANEGVDEVRTELSWTLGANVENLSLLGTAAINATGNGLANRLVGNSAVNTLSGGDGDDVLDGGPGLDKLIGGAGNDTYYIDATVETVTEKSGGGTDTVVAAFTYTLGTYLDNLTLSGSAAIDGTGNGSDNVLIGNTGSNTLTGAAGNDTLDGGAGSDRLVGGTGNDTYDLDVPSDIVVERANEGVDTVRAAFDFTLSDANLENLNLIGSALSGMGNALANVLIGTEFDNVLSGLAGNDTLHGAAGNDTLIGGTGNDTYAVDSSLDAVVEAVGEGTDLVRASVDFTLGANVENLTLIGTVRASGTGNDLANMLVASATGSDLHGQGGNDTLTGGAGSDLLDGGTGVDSMSGGAGDDTYVVDLAADMVSESSNGGTDEIQTYFSYTLGSAIENLTLLGAAMLNGTGNAGSNTIRGNAAANLIDGRGGADTMVGGGGDDTYIVDSLSDTIVELSGEGMDTVRTGIDGYRLSDGVEAGILTGTRGYSLTGNTGDNVLTGNSGNNTLHGGGSTFADGGGNDVFDGGPGADTMFGYLGSDTYYVDNAGDLVQDIYWTANYGLPDLWDRVFVSATWVAGSHQSIEEIVLTGTNAINVTAADGASVMTGNSAANVLRGIAGNDTINGAGGNDTLDGGTGWDTYIYNAGSGIDAIVDTADGNVVRFGPGLTADATAARSSVVNNVNRIAVYFLDAGGAEIAGQGLTFDLPSDQSSPISQFIFSDGTIRTLGNLLGTEPVAGSSLSAPDAAAASQSALIGAALQVAPSAVARFPLPALDQWQVADHGLRWYLGKSALEAAVEILGAEVAAADAINPALLSHPEGNHQWQVPKWQDMKLSGPLHHYLA